MESQFLADVQRDLEEHVDPAPRTTPKSFFKEPVKFHGVKTAVAQRIAAEHFSRIKGRSKEEIFALCEDLLKTDYGEEAFVAADWSYRLRGQYEPADFEVFERWVHKYVNNWAKCDTLCNHTIGAFVVKFPAYVERLKAWARSGNRWVRRASAVTLILPARKGMFLEEVLAIAGILLLDDDDLVQKGYGWMLKEASRLHRREVFDYVVSRKSVMPRTALRYAIEKMPDDLRRLAMQRG